MKVYELKYTVRHGEYVFRFMYLLDAKDKEDAVRLSHLWCKDFYGEGEKEEDDYYTFQCGCIGLRIDSVIEITNKKKWKDEQYEDAFIKDIE